MGTPFKLKSGNTSSFKSMGASPVKQTGVKASQPVTYGGFTKEESLARQKEYRDLKKAKQLTKKARKKLAKKSLGKVVTKVATRGAGRVLGGPAGLVAGLAYGAYKSGQKHSGGKAVKGQASFMEESKKKTKSIFKKK